MFSDLLKWLFTSTKGKVTSLAGSGVAIVVLVMAVQADVGKKLDKQEGRLKEYVNLTIKPIQTDIKNLYREQTETKNMVRDIHNYLLKSQNK